MKKESKDALTNELQDLKLNGFGYELIRESLIPDLLGKEYSSILYWAGKRLARKFPLETKEEITSFFTKAEWGSLVIIKEKKDTIVFELSSDLISNRFKRKEECSFQLETGFLAEQFQNQMKYLTEASEQQKRKGEKVLITVKWDIGDPL